MNKLLQGFFARLGNTKMVYPFVRLLGYEKTYGAARPDDAGLLIENFKSWVYACVQRNAYSLAKCEMGLYQKQGKELVEIEEHPFYDLMNKVNPFFNKFELMTLLGVFLELTGNAYWWIVKDQLGVPREIWNLPSNWVKIVPSKTEFIAGYVVKPPGNAVPIPFAEEEIIHFKYPSPFDLYYGTGPLLAARYGVDLNNEIKLYGINFLMNNAQPGGVLYMEDSLTPEQFKRLTDLWNAKHRGESNAGKMAILERGLKYQQVGQGLAEMRFEDIARSIRDEILAIFGVPASKLGLVEDVNRANADANDYTYQKETILPRLRLIEEKLNEKLIPMYDETLVVQFDNPVPEDKEFRLREQAEHIRSGYSSIDDERIEDNLEPYELPETSVPLIAFSLMPAGTPKPEAVEEGTTPEKGIILKDAKAKRERKWEVFARMTAPQEKLMTTTMRRYFEAQHKEVMHNLNNYKSISKEIKAGIIANILFNMNEQNEKLKVISTMHIKEALMSGAQLATDELGIDFNLIDPNIMKAVEQRSSFFAEKVNEATAELVKDELQEALKNGETIEDIARRLDKVFNYSEHFRSVRTARTEIIGAANDGQLQTYIEAGIEYKTWITARDERVRESHLIDGQTVGITEDFTTNMGNKLRYPGDRNTGADPSDIINCRCSVIAARTKE